MKKKIKQRKTYPGHIDPGIEVWCDGGVDTYLTFSREEVLTVIKKNSGLNEKDIGLKKVPRSLWSKRYITNIEDPYESKYSYQDLICKIIDEGWDGSPDLICTTEY